MLKKLGIPLLTLAAMLFLVPAPQAKAGVRFGVAIGGPAYVAPAPVYPYPAPGYVYPNYYNAYPAYPYVAPGYAYRWGGRWGGHAAVGRYGHGGYGRGGRR